MNEEIKSYLDARLRRHQLLSGGLFLIMLASIIWLSPHPLSNNDNIRAHSIQLVNEQGIVSGGLEFQDGNPIFYLSDSDGKKRFVATHDASGTSLFIKDDSDTTRVGIAQFAHGGGGFALHGKNSKGAAVLYLKEKGSLRFFDEHGQVTNQVTSTNE